VSPSQWRKQAPEAIARVRTETMTENPVCRQLTNRLVPLGSEPVNGNPLAAKALQKQQSALLSKLAYKVSVRNSGLNLRVCV
jgi:hypothetical protein